MLKLFSNSLTQSEENKKKFDKIDYVYRPSDYITYISLIFSSLIMYVNWQQVTLRIFIPMFCFGFALCAYFLALLWTIYLIIKGID